MVWPQVFWEVFQAWADPLSLGKACCVQISVQILLNMGTRRMVTHSGDAVIKKPIRTILYRHVAGYVFSATSVSWFPYIRDRRIEALTNQRPSVSCALEPAFLCRLLQE